MAIDFDGADAITVQPSLKIVDPATREQQLRPWSAIVDVCSGLGKALDQRLEAEHGLTLTALEALSLLHDADDQRMRMCELARATRLSRSGLTRLADRLERDGLLARDRCCDDARGSFAALTADGRELVLNARSTHDALIEELLLTHLDEAERDSVETALNRVVAAIADVRGCC